MHVFGDGGRPSGTITHTRTLFFTSARVALTESTCHSVQGAYYAWGLKLPSMLKICRCMWAIVSFPSSQTCRISFPNGSILFVRLIRRERSRFLGKWEFFPFCIYSSCKKRPVIISSSKPVGFPVQSISGTIPDSFGQLTNLTELDLSFNHLTGEFKGWSYLNRLTIAISRRSLYSTGLGDSITLGMMFQRLSWQCRACFSCFTYNAFFVLCSRSIENTLLYQFKLNRWSTRRKLSVELASR